MKRKANPVAKTTRPLFTGIFPRERLFTLLDLHRSRPIVWISGPLCSGKTTLASSYIEARNLSCLWYQIDSRDDDPATFGPVRRWSFPACRRSFYSDAWRG